MVVAALHLQRFVINAVKISQIKKRKLVTKTRLTTSAASSVRIVNNQSATSSSSKEMTSAIAAAALTPSTPRSASF